MSDKKIKLRFFNISTLPIIGIVLIFILALILLLQGNATSIQAEGAVAAGVYFEGEYRIADGQWREIVKGSHIPTTKGDVTLKGNFHLVSPDGEYIGLFTGNAPIVFYTDHINLTFYKGESEPYVIDHENPLFGDSACGVDWTVHYFTEETAAAPVEIIVHNPHRFGNETAIDEMLDKVAIWSGIDFENSVLDSDETQKNTGLFFIIISLLFFGTALFSTLIHIKNSKILWILGIVILFAGTYFIYSVSSIPFQSEMIISNTTILGCSMMFYMLFLLMTITHALKKTKKAGVLTVAILAAFNALFFILPSLTNVLFYDLWIYWALLQILANIVLSICIIKEAYYAKGIGCLLYIGTLLPLISFVADVVMTGLGVWKGGVASKYVFVIFFITAIILVLRIIPRSINMLAKAKELETEKIVLNAQLTESRISTMMSQIHPHFIYNTLGSIEQLCNFDPPKAGELVHNFAKYLRGNFGELDNPRPILMSQEMEHVHYYISIETVRFPDITFSFEMNSSDFNIPALTIQPIVENAIKHGLMKLSKGGTIRVVSYEDDLYHYVSVEDDGVGFDTNTLLDDRVHVGIRNIRGRLKAMVNGTLEIESTEGVGTKVLITIPKETEK